MIRRRADKHLGVPIRAGGVTCAGSDKKIWVRAQARQGRAGQHSAHAIVVFSSVEQLEINKDLIWSRRWENNGLQKMLYPLLFLREPSEQVCAEYSPELRRPESQAEQRVSQVINKISK